MGARPVNSLEETEFFAKTDHARTPVPVTATSDTAEVPSAERRIRILVVDDHPLVRHGISLLINRQSDFVCCDCDVGTLAGIIPALEKYRPDLLVLDLNLKDGSALPLIAPLKSQFPSLTILILSQFEEMLCAEEALRAGAAGYVLKEEATQEILAAIQAVLHHEIYLSHKMAAAFLNQLVGAEAPLPVVGTEHLTTPELEVFQLLGMGMSTFEIAGQMEISVKSVETHRKRLREKLKLPDNDALTDYAVRCKHGFNQNCDDPGAALLHCAVQWEQWEKGKSPSESKKPSVQSKPPE